MRTVIENGTLFDTESLSFTGEAALVIEEGLITDIVSKAPQADLKIDARGQYVIPGFIDAHIHLRLATMDFRKLSQWSEVEFGLHMARLATETLQRGFTTVRDLGGDVEGIIRAIRSGVLEGPRITRAGRMISQTGGHGDAEGGARPVPDCACQMRHTAFGIVADGVDAVRKAARHNLRDGSDFLKIHVSGGVATPSDPLDCTQYTADEIAAVVAEARNRRTYVAAHAYTPEAIALAVEEGVHSIEHGNLIDRAAAEAMTRKGAVMVPTLATYEAMFEFGAALGLPAVNREKNKAVYDAGLASLEIARAAGVTLGFGTDLIGETQNRQNREFAIRAEVEPARDILRALYQVNAKLCRLEGKVGTLKPGAFGDVVIARQNPLENIRTLAEPETALSHVLKGGKPVARPAAEH